MEEEKIRLELRGAVIIQRGEIERVNGDISISRSFGDKGYKEFLISEPDILQFEISLDDKYVLLATDGFWDVTIQLLYFTIFYLFWLLFT